MLSKGNTELGKQFLTKDCFLFLWIKHLQFQGFFFLFKMKSIYKKEKSFVKHNNN